MLGSDPKGHSWRSRTTMGTIWGESLLIAREPRATMTEHTPFFSSLVAGASDVRGAPIRGVISGANLIHARKHLEEHPKVQDLDFRAISV